MANIYTAPSSCNAYCRQNPPRRVTAETEGGQAARGRGDQCAVHGCGFQRGRPGRMVPAEPRPSRRAVQMHTRNRGGGRGPASPADVLALTAGVRGCRAG